VTPRIPPRKTEQAAPRHGETQSGNRTLGTAISGRCVEQNDVGTNSRGDAGRGIDVRCLGDDRQPRRTVEDRPQTGPNERVLGDDKNGRLVSYV